MTKKERELMNLFWEADTPLARGEILERAQARTCSWKPNSIHIIINNLLDKGVLQVAGLYLNSRKLGRTFLPALSLEEYLMFQVKNALDDFQFETGIPSQKLLQDLLSEAKKSHYK